MDVPVCFEGGVTQLLGVLIRDLDFFQGRREQQRDAEWEVGIIQCIGQKVRKQWSRSREQPDGEGEEMGHDGVEKTFHGGVGDDIGDNISRSGEREGGKGAERHALHEERGARRILRVSQPCARAAHRHGAG